MEYKPVKLAGMKVKKKGTGRGRKPTGCRMYQPIWEQIKESHTTGIPVTVTCPKQLRQRIKKAVIQEKWKDEEWEHNRNTKLNAKEIDEGWVFYLTNFRVGEVINRELS